MSNIDNLKVELSEAITFETVRIAGYTTLVSLGANILSEEARIALSNILEQCTERLTMLTAALESLDTLVLAQYPTRETLVLSKEVSDELQYLLESIRIVISESVATPLTVIGLSEISDEIAI